MLPYLSGEQVLDASHMPGVMTLSFTGRIEQYNYVERPYHIVGLSTVFYIKNMLLMLKTLLQSGLAHLLKFSLQSGDWYQGLRVSQNNNSSPKIQESLI